MADPYYLTHTGAELDAAIAQAQNLQATTTFTMQSTFVGGQSIRLLALNAPRLVQTGINPVVTLDAATQAALIPGNIKRGVTILGVYGTHEGSAILPKLNAPTITRSGTVLTITNPSTNGNFNEGFVIYKNGAAIAEQTGATIDVASYMTEAGTYTFNVRCKAEHFQLSDNSNGVSITI